MTGEKPMKKDVRISLNDEDSKKGKCFPWYKCIEFLVSLAIPITITVYTILQDKRQFDIAREHREQDADLANRTRLNDIQMANELSKNSLLNDYLDFLADLLERHGGDLEKDPSARLVARFKTLTVLKQLDMNRNTQIIRALYQAKLINVDYLNKSEPIIDLSFASLHDLDLTPSHRSFLHDFSNAYLSKTDLSNASFRNLHIIGTKFEEALMNGADFTGTSASDAYCRNNYTSFQSTSLIGAHFVEASYDFANFNDAIMNQSQLQSFHYAGCYFIGTHLSEADLSYSKHSRATCKIQETGETKTQVTVFESNSFINTILYNSTFTESVFNKTVMIRTNASKIKFDNCQFYELKCINCSFVNSIMINSIFDFSDLTGSTMVNTQINGTQFKFTMMQNIDFSYGKFNNCTFFNVNFTDSIFINTSFNRCDFQESSITEKQLQQALQLINITLPNETIINF